MKKYAQLLINAESFYTLIKVSYIRKIKDDYVVFSNKGRSFGKYKTKEEAEKRLKQIEFFKFLSKQKHKKTASNNKEEKLSNDEILSYSFLVREFNKVDKKIAINFQKVFKKYFDIALIKKINEPQNFALFHAIKSLDPNPKLHKEASGIEMGDPVYAGKYLANIIKFLLQRIKPEKRSKSIENLKGKIYYINEYDIAKKKVPSSSSLGQSISLVKTVLLDHEPQYIRKVLNNIVKFL